MSNQSPVLYEKIDDTTPQCTAYLKTKYFSEILFHSKQSTKSNQWDKLTEIPAYFIFLLERKIRYSEKNPFE